MPSSNESIFQHANKSIDLTHFFSDEPADRPATLSRFGTLQHLLCISSNS